MKDLILCSLPIAFVVVVFLAWVTHLVVCFSTAAWGFLIAGAIMFPIGIFHGFGVWFGFW